MRTNFQPLTLASASCNYNVMNSEEFQALEAALAFFDECTHTVANFASDHSSDDMSSVHDAESPQVSDVTVVHESARHDNDIQHQLSQVAQEIAHVKAKLLEPGRNRSRDLQKLELLQLRLEAAELKEKVDELRYHGGRESNAVARRGDDRLLVAWKAMAKKQKTLRRGAEMENKNLRELLVAQLKSIKALKRLLQKRREEKRAVCRTRNFYVYSVFETERQAINVLEMLSSSLGKLFAETDRTFQQNGLSVAMSPLSKIDIQPISSSITHIEILKCSFLPFDFRDVAKAFYGEMGAGCGLDEVENSSDPQRQNVVARSFTVEVEERVKIQYRYAGIKYSEHKREVIVLSGRNELVEAFGVALDGVGFHEKCWCVMSEVAPNLCLLQLCIGLTVEAKHVAPGRQQFLSQLCEMLAHLKQEVFEMAQRDVEHDLLIAL